MNKFVDAVQLIRGKAVVASSHPAVAGPLAKVVSLREWWPAVLAVTMALISNSNIAAAVLAAQAWSLGKEKAFDAFLKVAFYLALSVVLGPNLALVVLMLDCAKAEVSNPDDNQTSSTGSVLSDYVVAYRALACRQFKILLDQLATSQPKMD